MLKEGKYELTMSLPLYSQLPNCCGISTYLMLINPEKNLHFKKVLNSIYSKIRFLKKEKKPEFKWSVVLDYILLKSVGKNILRKYLYRKIPNIVEYYMPIIHFDVKNEGFSNNNLVSRYVLRKSLFTMRTDADLKILFYLFGGRFYPQEQEISDGTGGLYFTKRDFEGEHQHYKTKLNIMKDHLQQKKHNQIPSIALNMGHHWVAIQDVEVQNDLLVINNPLGGRHTYQIRNSIPDYYRFYLFDYNPEKSFILSLETEFFLNSEIVKEFNRYKSV